MAKYIYQSPTWPNFIWKEAELNLLLGEVRFLQGKIAGQMSTIGFLPRQAAQLNSLTLDVVKSSEIEGEHLNYDQVRSSVAIRLGIEAGGLATEDRRVDGVVDMVLDATVNFLSPITKERLCGWHAALFPTGYSGPYKIEVGRYRSGEMQIVSGAMGKEKVHYLAVEAARVPQEMGIFIDWLNSDVPMDPVLKAAVAHFWFIIIHPFDDGNGRIARAISDLFLARSEKSAERFYSMSSQMLIQKKNYYATLQKVQHSDGDITDWMHWFLDCVHLALVETESQLRSLMVKTEFWYKMDKTPINERQRILLNKLFDHFDGHLSTSKWAKIAKCSHDTALRDIKDLVEKGILREDLAGGRSKNYRLVAP
jgi:Fic family protein